MAAEELAANQRAAGPATDPVARDVARWATARELTPVAMAAIALGFGAIAAVWLTAVSTRAGLIAFVALLFAFVAGRAGRLMGASDADAVTDWGVAACAVLTELAVYAGIAGSASANAAHMGLTGPVGTRLRGTSLASFGGPGADGVWRLAVAAMIGLALVEMASVCLAAARPDASPSRFEVFVGAPGGARLLLIGVAVLLAGARVTFLLLLALSGLALMAMLVRGIRAAAGQQAEAVPGQEDSDPALQLRSLPGCRGDGPLAVWIGRFVAGRLPPLPPLLVGLLVTGMLVALGLQNLPGILVLTPVEAMMLATLASWHAHDGKRDWLAPPLLQAGEYVYLAAAGFAGRVWAPVTLALLAAVVLRHQELAYQSLAQPARRPHADRRGLGWEARMIIVGIAAAAGILKVGYPLLAVYLWAVLAREFAVGWSAGHAAVDG
jgi:hypothetical protein